MDVSIRVEDEELPTGEALSPTQTVSEDEQLILKGIFMHPRMYLPARTGNTQDFLHALDEAVKELERTGRILKEENFTYESLLHEAVTSGNNEIVELIAKKYIGVFSHKNIRGDTPLHVAARGARVSTVKILLHHAKMLVEDEYNRLVEVKNKYEHTAFHEAVINGNQEMVKIFIDECYNIFRDYSTDLMILAVIAYDKPSFQLLWSAYPREVHFGMWAAMKDGYKAVKKEERIASELDKLYQGEIPRDSTEARSILPKLFEAAKKGQNELFFKAFDKIKATRRPSILPILSERGPSGNSLLHVAASCGNKVIVEFIVSNFFCQMFVRNSQGDTPLHVAARGGHLETLQILLRHTIEEDVYFLFRQRSHQDIFLLKEKNIQGQTALHEAVYNEHHEIVKFLVNKYAEIFDDYRDGDPLLQTAVKSNNMTIVHELLSALYRRLSSYEEPGIFDEDGHFNFYELPDPTKVIHAAIFGAAHAAIIHSRTDMFKEMFEKIPSLKELRDKEGRYPLHWAAQTGDLDAVHFLLSDSTFKGTLFKADNTGMLPIHIAAQEGHVEIIRQFIDHWPEPADLITEAPQNNMPPSEEPDFPDEGQQNAAEGSNLPTEGHQNNQEPQRSDLPVEEGQNILHIAARTGNNKVVKYILTTPEVKEVLNQKDNHGNTPLHIAAKNSNTSVVFSLTWDDRLKKNLLNIQGLTPLDVFWQNNKDKASLRHSLTVSALKSAGCKENWELKEGKYKGYCSDNRKLKRSELKRDQVGALVTAATLVATVTFTAGFTVPGGYNGSDSADKGLATLFHKPLFQVFVLTNIISFFLSILSIISCFYAIDDDNGIAANAFALAKRLFGVALFMMAIAFMAAIFLGVSKLSWLAYLALGIGILFMIILFFESLRSLIPIFLEQRFARRISYYMSRAMIFLFVKDHTE